MIRVRDLMTSEVIALAPELTLREAIETLAQRRIGGAPVVANQTRLVGVISASDILAFQASLPGVPTDRSDQQIELDEYGPEEGWEEGAEPAGAYFTELWADAGAELPARLSQVQGPEWDVLEEHTVAEAMSRAVRTVSPETPAVEAARRMVADRIHRLLVVEPGGRLVGILSSMDFVRAVARGKLALHRPPAAGDEGGGS
ncbi:MAG TPA: CBS domain-containing protein [Gemmatimonadales bacterium]|nr:CBS domain-containing protein [Gemmatimonadales bacterium]